MHVLIDRACAQVSCQQDQSEVKKCATASVRWKEAQHNLPLTQATGYGGATRKMLLYLKLPRVQRGFKLVTCVFQPPYWQEIELRTMEAWNSKIPKDHP